MFDHEGKHCLQVLNGAPLINNVLGAGSNLVDIKTVLTSPAFPYKDQRYIPPPHIYKMV